MSERGIHILPSSSLCSGWSNVQVLPGSAPRIAGHQAEMTSAWQWIILFKELSPVEGRAQNHHLVSDKRMTCCQGILWLQHFTWHLEPTLFERIEQKQNRLGQSTMEHASNKYLSILRLDVWLSEQAAHRLMQSFVWLRPVNEDQSLPSPAGTDGNQQLMKAL